MWGAPPGKPTGAPAPRPARAGDRGGPDTTMAPPQALRAPHMTHGIDAYFLEHARFRRRLAGFITGVGIGLLALHGFVVWLGRSPAISAALHQTHILRWGYEGPEQYVRRIELKAEAGASSRNPGAQARYIPASRRGGRRGPPPATHPPPPAGPRPPPGPARESAGRRRAPPRAPMA